MNIEQIDILLSLIDKEIDECINKGCTCKHKYIVDLTAISKALNKLKDTILSSEYITHNIYCNMLENYRVRMKGGDGNDKEI